MRVDLLLNKLCLVKTRSIAKTACDKQLVSINGKTAKAAQDVKVNDMIRISLSGFTYEIKVVALPEGNVAKKDVTRYYSLLAKTEH